MITFINPWAFIWLLLALPILGLYAWKQRRYVHQTGAGEIWKDSISLLDPRFWWSPWRRLVSLLVQLAILVTFVFAMAEPCLRPPQRLAVIIDCTQSMSNALGINGEKDSHSEVRQKLEEMIKNMGYHDRIALIAAQSPAKILCRTTSEPEKALQALDNYLKNPVLTQNAQAMDSAIEVARALVATKAREELNPRTQNIVLVSDGCFAGFSAVIQKPGVHWLPVGKSRDNFALVSAGVRAKAKENTIAVLVATENFSENNQTGVITIGNQSKDVSASPNKRVNTIINIDAAEIAPDGTIAISWKPSAGEPRTISLPAVQAPLFHAFLVSRGNPILEEKLRAIPVIDKVESVKKIPDSLPENAIVVLDGASPAELPNAYTISFGSKKNSNLWNVTEQPVDAIIDTVNVQFDENLWNGNDLIGVRFQSDAQLQPLGANTVLAADSTGAPLAWALEGSKPAQHFLFACSLAKSDWQSKSDFGAMISNIVLHWSNGQFDPFENVSFADEDWRIPQSSEDVFSLPGEDVIPLWTILGVILLIALCAEWILYQRRWLE